MRTLIRLAGLAALTAAASLPAGLASAGDAKQPSALAEGRIILVCDTDAATRRGFTREHGAAPIFVTAREALSVRTSDPAWNAPRCMTAREHARYREAVTTFAAVR
ncbi:MAG: hypothetical protein Q8R45_14995 [Brevundimonas sp.]|uniref:hypothetical protein n=1 Tax=Brevundimonas sp. TaxID=1871086 RepID=UPI002726D086|nr:hypothetical protein [Brevundimonas sp.]MDO9586979.1 hypothetical protein [Brevundimonas sp.]MDP3370448.1 hypothetical protein [Brevundimonas sp.]MDP3658258.1 hypothetical protein [Brevundimonas sp.]MDZ4113001.1 hypothetical protein [Brevundimonas sp.]